MRLIPPVARRATALERVASQARALIQLRRTGMRSVLEQRHWNVCRGQLVMAAAAVVGCMTGRAGDAIQGGVPPVNVVFPPGRVRNRTHLLVARYAPLPRRRGRRNAAVAGKAFRVR